MGNCLSNANDKADAATDVPLVINMDTAVELDTIAPVMGLSSKPVVPADFRKIKILGKGAVGRVYLVQFKENDELFAMKVLSKKEMIEKNKVKRVLTEHEVLASTDHPLIVTLYASFQAKDYLFFVMEYCPGGEFFRMLKRQPGKRLEEDAARFYAAEVLLALEYLHKCGFMYRDLKPENILLSKDGHIRLTDFDLSQKHVTPESLLSRGGTITDSATAKCTSFVGTLEYVAPEMIMGTPHDSSVDWWTFGILLYEMLFGRTPFVGKSMADAFRSIVACKLEFPSNIPISSACRELIQSLLVKQRRLGSQSGAADIKAHRFFKDINWDKLHLQTAPIIPQLESATDTKNFVPPRDGDDFDWEGTEPTRDDTFKSFGYEKRTGLTIHGQTMGSTPDLQRLGGTGRYDYTATV
eukprot:TRINITY_DN132_c0_g1_i3.p1 TRINITY_DN132_c0_g1~~TRINITY_DN132_c0_g1_i3.p1  ORF type:complete len:411 (-),score=85.78 TRINITY_DN132_c0_g1_i3:548-1780(-)